MSQATDHSTDLPLQPSQMEAIFHQHIGNAWEFTAPQLAYATALVRAAQAAMPVPHLVMANGSPLLEYLNVPADPPGTDEWTRGYHESRRRLHAILAPQLAAAPALARLDFPNRSAVEQAIPGGDQWSDGYERVALPAGVLRYMLALIDRRAAANDGQVGAMPSSGAAPHECACGMAKRAEADGHAPIA